MPIMSHSIGQPVTISRGSQAVCFACQDYRKYSKIYQRAETYRVDEAHLEIALDCLPAGVVAPCIEAHLAARSKEVHSGVMVQCFYYGR